MINQSEPASASYKVEIDAAAVRDIKKMAQGVKAEIMKIIRGLANEPRPHGVESLQGYSGYYRVRTGNYRIIYTINDGIATVLVVAVGDRKEIYDMIKRRS